MAKLQRDAVIAAALDLLNEVGVDGLTTRKLAERLGVQQPALYWHFKSKQALLDALSDAMMRGHIHTLPSPGGPWKNSCTPTRAASAARCWPIATAPASTPAPAPPNRNTIASRRRSSCCATPASRRCGPPMRWWPSATTWSAR